MKRIPLTLITGFLGSGKTTFINRWMTTDSKSKFFIVENEFGSVGIDGQLLGLESDRIAELHGGCICCSINNRFADTLYNALESGICIDQMVVETTGIADPLAVLSGLLDDYGLQSAIELRGIVALADAQLFASNQELPTEAIAQIASADIIAFTKTDLVNPHQLQTVTQQILALNPLSSVFLTIDELINSGSLINNTEIPFEVIGERMKNKIAISAKHGVESHSFEFDRPFDAELFKFWMHNFLYFNRSTIFRIKGLISLSDDKRTVLFQSVRDTYMYQPYLAVDKHPKSQIVFIGKNLDRELLANNLAGLLSAPVFN